MDDRPSYTGTYNQRYAVRSDGFPDERCSSWAASSCASSSARTAQAFSLVLDGTGPTSARAVPAAKQGAAQRHPEDLIRQIDPHPAYIKALGLYLEVSDSCGGRLPGLAYKVKALTIPRGIPGDPSWLPTRTLGSLHDNVICGPRCRDEKSSPLRACDSETGLVRPRNGRRAGDRSATSDNIPGVRGCKLKTAGKLFHEYARWKLLSGRNGFASMKPAPAVLTASLAMFLYRQLTTLTFSCASPHADAMRVRAW